MSVRSLLVVDLLNVLQEQIREGKDKLSTDKVRQDAGRYLDELIDERIKEALKRCFPNP